MGNMKLKNRIQFERFWQAFCASRSFFTPFDTTMIL